MQVGIPITAENANRIRGAVHTLRTSLRRAGEVTPDPSVTTLLVRMNAWYEEVSAAAGRALLDAGTKAALQGPGPA